MADACTVLLCTISARLVSLNTLPEYGPTIRIKWTCCLALFKFSMKSNQGMGNQLTPLAVIDNEKGQIDTFPRQTKKISLDSLIYLYTNRVIIFFLVFWQR
ncbi:uncharacterized protein LOC107263393 [Cephus cinctus]|uniref:Uncharacterized protein LOC107263393 n=1 Tax=Cephus cinctus TaxID=211228 RepID=A0AAJ7BHE4_CEPCN|nr:uncharacterized protein LOC107263393 [Cephus cinctus]